MSDCWRELCKNVGKVAKEVFFSMRRKHQKTLCLEKRATEGVESPNLIFVPFKKSNSPIFLYLWITNLNCHYWNHPSINQSINQSVNQSINQSINQIKPINQSTWALHQSSLWALHSSLTNLPTFPNRSLPTSQQTLTHFRRHSQGHDHLLGHLTEKVGVTFQETSLLGCTHHHHHHHHHHHQKSFTILRLYYHLFPTWIHENPL